MSVAVDGDVDKEYFVYVRGLGSAGVYLKFNNSTDLGRQYLINSAGSISAGRTTIGYIDLGAGNHIAEARILTPAGFQKTADSKYARFSSGTTIDYYANVGQVWNSTDNVTSLDFFLSSGDFTAGDRIWVGVRRSNV